MTRRQRRTNRSELHRTSASRLRYVVNERERIMARATEALDFYNAQLAENKERLQYVRSVLGEEAFEALLRGDEPLMVREGGIYVEI